MYRFGASALLVFALVTAWAGASAQEPKDRFDKSCGGCHKVEVVIGFMKKHPDAAKRKAWLDGKLAKHNAPDAKLRADVITYLEQVYAKSAK